MLLKLIKQCLQCKQCLQAVLSSVSSLYGSTTSISDGIFTGPMSDRGGGVGGGAVDGGDVDSAGDGVNGVGT